MSESKVCFFSKIELYKIYFFLIYKKVVEMYF